MCDTLMASTDFLVNVTKMTSPREEQRRTETCQRVQAVSTKSLIKKQNSRQGILGGSQYLERSHPTKWFYWRRLMRRSNCTECTVAHNWLRHLVWLARKEPGQKIFTVKFHIFSYHFVLLYFKIEFNEYWLQWAWKWLECDFDTSTKLCSGTNSHTSQFQI